MWQPLNDHWDEYQAGLEEADAAGLLDDPERAQEVIYPEELNLGDNEKEDVREFVSDRLNELWTAYEQSGGGFNIDLIGTYIFRAIVLGMAWERERIGR